MWVRKRIDIGWLDLAFAVRGSIAGGAAESAKADVENHWSGDWLACFSVRTSLDLFLQAANYERGSEVLVSAVTIADMVGIIEEHGLVAVPIDVQTDDMSVSIDSLKPAITDKTRLVLVAHLFGTIADLTPVIETAHEAGLLVFEDCAQAFDGDRYQGHPLSDVVAFSFGPIKSATALGGALVRINDEDLRTRMRAIEAKYPVQRRWVFLKRVFKYGVLKLLGTRTAFRLLVLGCGLFGRRLDDVLSQSVRNFAGGSLFTRLRQRPSVPLLRLMERRLKQFDMVRHDRRCQSGQLVLQKLGPLIHCPGGRAARHSFWVFVVESPQSAILVSALRTAGFDATTVSQLRVLMPGSSLREIPVAAEAMVPRMIFLPYYPEMPDAELIRMADVIRHFVASDSNSSSSIHAHEHSDTAATGETASHAR